MNLRLDVAKIVMAAITIVALPFTVRVAVADHASDLAKCNAISDVVKRSACLSLISPGGQAPAASPTTTAQPASAAPNSDACKQSGDFTALIDCLVEDKSAAEPAAANSTEDYYAAISRCGKILGQLALRSQCLHTVGQPPAAVDIPRSTYDDQYQAAISACVANRYSIDAEACELDALMQAMQRQHQRSAQASATAQTSSEDPPATKKLKKVLPKPTPTVRATSDEVAKMVEALGSGPGQWIVYHERSPITDTENVSLRIASKEIIPASYGPGEPAYLYLRCLDDRTDVLFTMAGNWFYDEHRVTSRIDKKPAVTHSWYQSSDNEAAFSPDPIPFIKELATAKQLIVQTAPISSPLYLATFDLTGIADVVKPLRAACGW